MGWSPICCAADLSSEFLDDFVKVSLETSRQAELMVVVVDDLRHSYTEPSKSPMKLSHSPPPFRGNNAEECFEMLQQMVEETGSDLELNQFAILDDRSVEDSTVLIAQAFKAGDVKTVRATMEDTDRLLTNLMVGGISIGELQQEASKAEDGVWRHDLRVTRASKVLRQSTCASMVASN